MGTTLAALQTGSIHYKIVVAIEGVPYLLTNATQAQAVAAWAGTDWTQALNNITVNLQNESSIDPWSPFTSGGSCSIGVLPDSILGDVLGVMAGRSDSGAFTSLVTSMSRTTSAITVLDTSQFAASGELHIGTECIGYSGKTSTTFTGLTRGKFAPFAAGALVTRCARTHRTGADATNTIIAPTVSEFQRTWRGRSIGVWMHRVEAGVLDVRSEAQLIYAGKIADVRDDAGTGACMIDCEHVLDDVKDFVLWDNPWSAKIADGVFIPLGTKFFWYDVNASGTQRTANTLTAVASPTLSYEMASGVYSLSQLCNQLNAWLSAEKGASRLFYDYVFVDHVDTGNGIRGQLTFYTQGSVGLRVFLGVLPPSAGTLLGWPAINGVSSISRAQALAGFYEYNSPAEPRSSVFPLDGANGFTLPIRNPIGSAFDNTSTMRSPPDPVLRASIPTGWGLFIVDGKFSIIALNDGSGALKYVSRDLNSNPTDTQAWLESGRPISSESSATVQQVLSLQGTFAELLNMIFCSTDVAAYNGANDKGFPGLGIPNELLGTSFFNSTAALQHSAVSITIALLRPTKLAEVFGPDLILRRANLVWKNQKLLMNSWSTPSAASSLHNLTEANKADQGDNNQRSATALSESWIKNLVKFEYGRNLVTGDYSQFITLKDQASIDDHNGADVMTVSLPHEYGYVADIESAIMLFLGYMPQLSRANALLVRSIAPTHFENMAAGDIVTVDDNFARNPVTGQRGVTGRTGIVIAHKYAPGGGRFDGGSDGMVGEVTIMLAALDRNFAYAPTALVDISANTGGYTGGYDNAALKLRTVASNYSAANDASDFATGDLIRIIEVSGSIASPDTWLRSVTAVVGADITINAALAAPAFNPSKNYRIISNNYSVANATQKLKSYQALSSSGRIASLAPADLYTINNSANPFALSLHTEPGELIASVLFADGAPLDSGTDEALAITANWLEDHHTRHLAPMLHPVAVTNAAAGYKAIMFAPIYLGGNIATAGRNRYLNVAPHFRSTTGAAVGLRVTLLKNRPTSITLVDAVRPTPYAQAEFTTSSTTFVTPATQALEIDVTKSTGEAYLLVEATQFCETYGLANINESHRQ